jgi:uncharacterized OB-fold protein
MSAKPKPDIHALNAPFWEGTAKGELRIRHCASCGARFRFTHAWCPSCWSSVIGWEVASGRGTVATYSVVHLAPYAAFADIAPYVLALVDLEEGVRMMCNIVDCDPREVRIGMPVSVQFEDRGGTALPQFRPR